MHVGKLVFAQLMDHLPWKSFARIVQRYGGDHRVRHFSCANQFRCMAFAQLTYRESLRDIEACLQAQRSKLYHLGIQGSVARSTLADAYDNAMAESFFASLECELIDRRSFQTKAEARLALFTYIEGWYNPRRRHSALGRVSPINYERSHIQDKLPAIEHSIAAPETAWVPSG